MIKWCDAVGHLYGLLWPLTKGLRGMNLTGVGWRIGQGVKGPKILVWKLTKMKHQKSKGQTAVIDTGSRKKYVSVIT